MRRKQLLNTIEAAPDLPSSKAAQKPLDG